MDDSDHFMGRPMYWRLVNGEVVPGTLDDWIERGRAPTRFLFRNEIPYGDTTILISTVFLGLDHGFSIHGPPVVFETMIFWEGHPLDNEQWRYTTLAEAKAGHLHALQLVRDALNALPDDLDATLEAIDALLSHPPKALPEGDP